MAVQRSEQAVRSSTQSLSDLRVGEGELVTVSGEEEEKEEDDDDDDEEEEKHWGLVTKGELEELQISADNENSSS